ncbi:MAG TPA: hypothetical protein VF604_18135 [Pyrinomonadaceae bacterium]|jgi:hypothetical protein
MSGVAKEWAVVLIFLVAVAGLTLLEAFWINRKGWTGFGRSLAFSVSTNFIGFAVGFFVMFVVFGVVLAMAWDGSIEKFPLKDYGIGAFLVCGVLFFPLFLMLCKRLFLKLFKIQTGKTAWLFSLAAALAIFIISQGLPALAAYLLM